MRAFPLDMAIAEEVVEPFLGFEAIGRTHPTRLTLTRHFPAGSWGRTPTVMGLPIIPARPPAGLLSPPVSWRVRRGFNAALVHGILDLPIEY